MLPPFRIAACLLLTGVFVIDNPHCGTGDPDHARLALAYLDDERYGRALMEIQRALRQRDDDPDLHLIAAMAHLGLEQLEEAVQDLGAGLQLTPDDLRLHQTLRDICQQFSCAALARPILEDLLHQHPDSPYLQTSLGWIYAEQEEMEKAVDLLSRATAGEIADDIFAHVQLSRIYRNQERFAEAVQTLEKALLLVPDDQRLLLALGETYLQRGEPENATEVFARSLENSPSPGATATRIALIFYEQGMRLRAIQYYERALTLGSDRALVLNNLAWTYAEEEVELERALELATRAVKLDPDNVVYLDTYAELFYKQGQPARAVAVMRRALERETADGEHYAYLREQMEKFQQPLAVSAALPPGDR